MADPNWNNGFYYDGLPPHTGMKLARRMFIFFPIPLIAHLDTEIATITYRSGPEWDLRFGRQLRPIPEPDSTPPGYPRTPALCPDFLIETYLDHQVCNPCSCARLLLLILNLHKRESHSA